MNKPNKSKKKNHLNHSFLIGLFNSDSSFSFCDCSPAPCFAWRNEKRCDDDVTLQGPMQMSRLDGGEKKVTLNVLSFQGLWMWLIVLNMVTREGGFDLFFSFNELSLSFEVTCCFYLKKRKKNRHVLVWHEIWSCSRSTFGGRRGSASRRRAGGRVLTVGAYRWPRSSVVVSLSVGHVLFWLYHTVVQNKPFFFFQGPFYRMIHSPLKKKIFFQRLSRFWKKKYKKKRFKSHVVAVHF